MRQTQQHPHQSSLAMQGFEASLPPPKHKRSTDEVFSEPQRLHKVLASCGFGSRRAMEDLILAGRITVNRMPAEIGQKVGPGDEVRINGEPVNVRFAEPKARVLVYHKPTGELVTRDDPEERPTVFGMLPAISDGRWIAVGRLDYNTEGLLLFTNSGELANRLMHPRYEVEREYAVRVMGRLSDEQIETLKRGVELEDGPAKCERVEDGGGDEDASNHWYKVVVKEGRNREVRRLFEALGLTVSRLIRVRYGRVSMPPPLKRGDVLELEPQEVNALLKSAGLKAQGGGAPPAAGQRPTGGKPKHARGEGQHSRGEGQRRAQHGGQQGGPGTAPAGEGQGRKRRRGRKRTANGMPGDAQPGQRHGAHGGHGARMAHVRRRAKRTATSRRGTRRPPGKARDRAQDRRSAGVADAAAAAERRRRRCGAKGPATQKWVGLPRDEEESV
ncbi:MAG: rRNA pseudouridine synthase [Betaproteobacteria bacterium]|nr:rRNA pseudouridine synthase [Betaproteobacteria bacterium]